MSSSEKSHGAAIQIDLDLRKNQNLRKIVPTTKILEHARLFDFRNMFNSSPSMTHEAAIQIDLYLRNWDLRKNFDLRKIVPTTKI